MRKASRDIWLITEKTADQESAAVSPLLERPCRRYWNSPWTFVASHHVLSGCHGSKRKKETENPKWDCGSEGSHWFKHVQRFRRREVNTYIEKKTPAIAESWCLVLVLYIKALDIYMGMVLVPSTYIKATQFSKVTPPLFFNSWSLLC